jgi:MOSC domain-containing protein YiiM
MSGWVAVPALLLSVNVGRAQTVPGGRRYVRSAIWKSPVDGRVAVRGDQVDGDEQADRRVHGGPDKAVYAYAVEETRRWEHELGRELGPAAFGENLTIEGLDVSGAQPGDRWAIGTTVLEVTQPRLPCAKLGVRMGDPRFVRRFAQAGRPGAYLRIAREGELGAGDAVEVVARAEHGVTVRDMAEAILVDHDRLPDLLAIPGLLPQWRSWIEERAA